MLNAGGALRELEHGERLARVRVRGEGEMKVYASKRPKGVKIDGEEAKFEYEEVGMVTIHVPWSTALSTIEYLF
ncbi:hypothetical protein MLD38_001382 [Melastoma candidum]|nr:hypothetical protein MLD38_001382 [Melastoma candidum]